MKRGTIAVVAFAIAVAGMAVVPSRPATAAGSPDVSLSVGMAGETLYGASTPVTLTVTNLTATNGYNLSYRAVLPAGVSASGFSVAPTRTVANQPNPGETTIIWENVSDTIAGTTVSISFDVAHATGSYDVGDSFTIDAGAYANTDPRTVPDFDAAGFPSGDYTGWDTASASTTLVPFEVAKTEPNTEAELLRGVHDHQTLYTIVVQNNYVNPTASFVVEDWIPAGLEFLACGNVDNSSAEEYPGSGPLNPGNAPSIPTGTREGCLAPSSVDTVVADPDGAGPMPNAVYTHVVWDEATLLAGFGTDTLAAGETFTLHYVAGIPRFENTTTWPGGAPTPASGLQAANLDNNTGPSTEETTGELALTNLAVATGDYDSRGVDYTDSATKTVTAEDVSIHKSVDDTVIDQGDVDTWTLVIETSEYVDNAGIGSGNVHSIVVTDTVPDGLCPLEAGSPDAECQIAGAPSHPYTSATENADGTWTLEWDFDSTAGLGSMTRSDTRTITFSTRVRQNYQENFADASPVLAEDSWVNTVSLTAVADGRNVADESSAGQEAGPVVISKEVSVPGPAVYSCGDGSGLTWDADQAGPYGPGDVVCWRLRVDYPATLDTAGSSIDDFLPAGFEYQSWTTGANNTVPVGDISFDGSGAAQGVLSWSVTSATVDAGAQVLELVVTSKITDATAASSADLPQNLMKFTFTNTPGEVFQYRDDADALWAEPELSLVKGVRDVDGVPAGGNGPDVDDVEIVGGNTITYRVDVTNSGTRDALDVQVWDVLPSPFTCAMVSNVSDGGICNATPDPDRIEWPSTGIDVPAGTSRTFTYDVTVPDLVATAGQFFVNTAGVVKYESDTNQGDRFVYVPANNVDPSAPASNTTAADDTSRVFTRDVTLTKGRTTSVTEPGNDPDLHAAIGEVISYTVTAVIPEGTSLHAATITDAIDTARLDYLGDVAATLDGGALPAGFTLSDAGGTIVLTFPDPYVNAAGSGDDTFEITFSARVRDDAGQDRGDLINNQARLRYENASGAIRGKNTAVSTWVVEPNLTVTKSSSVTNVQPGDVVDYTIVVTNTSGNFVSPAHEVVVVDTLPTELTPVDAADAPLVGNGTVPPSGGLWDEAARTITWSLSEVAGLDRIDPGDSVTLTYRAKVADSVVTNGTMTNTVAVTASSLDGTPTGERTSYSATDSNTVTAPRSSITKTVTPTSATIGEPIRYTVEVTLPANVIQYDVTVIDQLPSGIRVLSPGYTVSTSCQAAGGGACSPDITGIAELTPTGGDVGWFLGDLTTPSSDDRIVTIVFDAYVDDDPAATSGATLTNSVNVYGNQTDELGTITVVPDSPNYDVVGTPASVGEHIVEPRLTISKRVLDGATPVTSRRALPGETLTYQLTIRNTGTSDAYDLTVTDTPDARLVNAVVTSGTSNGVAYTVVDGDLGDGTLSWSIDGPLAPGADVVITYSADVWPATVADEVVLAEEILNTADVPSYWGVPEATRTANPQYPYRNYDDVPPSRAYVELDLASIGDTVWFDVDADGVIDAGEPRLGGVDVTVTYLGPDGVFGTADDETHTTTTAADGTYLVDRLPGGSYRVVVDPTDLPAGLAPSYDLDGGTASPDGVWNGTLAEDGVERDVDFGYTGTGSLGDRVWFDRDGDGVQDVDEPGLGGVGLTVVFAGFDGVVGTADDVAYSATTAADGTWSVPNLPAGSYTTTVNGATLPTGMGATYDLDDGTTSPDGAAAATLGAGEDRTDVDFGYRGSSSIGDTVWLDGDLDGIEDPGEDGIPGVTVTLVWPGPDGVLGNGDDVTFGEVTDAAGNYLFDGLNPGDYRVSVDTATLPTGLIATFDEDGGLDSTTVVTLPDATAHLTADFGYGGSGSIGDRVWWDTDGDGVQDHPTEPGIAGVEVRLTWYGPDGVLGTPDDVVQTRFTDATGHYLFVNLPAGQFDVDVLGGLPGVANPTSDRDGTLDGSTTVTLATGEAVSDADFGYTGDNAVGDLVWHDLDADGVQDAGEPGIAGVEVTVTWAGLDGVLGTGDDLAFPAAATDGAGGYLVERLPDGDFRVDVTGGVPTGMAATFDEDGGNDETSQVVGLSGGATHDTADFGYAGTGSIGDRIWWDLDGDGSQDPDEPGFPGVDVTVTWAGPDGVLGNGDDVAFADTTDAAGGWRVDHLPAGSFEVVVDRGDLPADVAATADPDGGVDDRSAVVLPAGATDLDQDFGYRGTSSLGDFVWLDLDADGTQDAGEPGVGGVDVTVTWLGADGVAGGGDDVVVVRTTDGGSYVVPGLVAGAYSVALDGDDLPPGTTASVDVDGGDPGTSAVTLAFAEDRRDVDFGIVGDASLEGTVWSDVDGDGIVDPAESGVPNVTVRVVWHGPEGAVTIPVVTGADGSWVLPSLPAGAYDVELDDTTTPTGTVPTTATTDAVTLPVGGHGRVDFGIAEPASVGSTVWIDDDGDGLKDPGEEGIAGVVVELLDASDLIVAVATTDAEGGYRFEGIPPGTYTVRLVSSTIPAGLEQSFSKDGVLDLQVVQTLVAGQAVLDVNFAFRREALPRTGFEAGVVLLVGFVLLAAGGVLLGAVGREEDEPGVA